MHPARKFPAISGLDHLSRTHPPQRVRYFPLNRDYVLLRKCDRVTANRTASMSDKAQPAILVVDDYQGMANLIRKVLHNMGYQNIEARTDGRRALQALRDQDFDLVICDHHMEPMSGLDLLHEIRKDERLNNLPFIMISGHASHDNVTKAMDEAATYYIAKPFTAKALKRGLNAALSAARRE